MWIAHSAVRGSWLGATAGATALGILAVTISVLTGQPAGPPPELARVADAHLALAEAYLERDALALAEREYRTVIERPESRAYWYAMYKIGCIEHALQRYGEALETMFRVAEGTQRDPEQHGLHRAATKDFVRAYAEIGRPETAYRSFRRVDREDAFEMLELLADLYQKQGKHDRAIAAYHELMTLAPTHKNVCLWQSEIVHAALWNVAGNGEAVEQVVRLVRLSRSLATAQALPAAELKACHDRAAAISGELARAYHVESVKAESGDPSARAERLYEVYLDAFPDADDFADTKYFYAELLWSRAESNWSPRHGAERWERVATVFTSLVELPTLDARRRQEAAQAAVLAWKNAGELKRGARQRSAAWLRVVSDPRGTLGRIDLWSRSHWAEPRHH